MNTKFDKTKIDETNEQTGFGGFPHIVFLGIKNKKIKEFSQLNKNDVENINKLNILNIKNILGV